MRVTLISAIFSIFISVLPSQFGALAQTGPANPLEEPRKPQLTFSNDPIGFVAHGALFDQSGKKFDPSPDFIRQTMKLYIDRMEGVRGAEDSAAVAEMRKRLEEEFGSDDMTQQFLMLEFLSRDVEPGMQAQLEVRNHVLRKYWFMQFMGKDRFMRDIDQRKNLPWEAVKFAEGAGMLLRATNASGREYIEECRKAEVPIPPRWNSNAWSYQGDLNTNFLGFGNPSEVWRADSDAPKGLCVALPRFLDADTISALGIICLGTESSNACIFDTGVIDADAELDAEDLISGADLSNGVCTDCHAGENPFIVHPGGPLDMWPDNVPAQWHSPLIKPSWPQNPGPFGLLDLVAINPLPPENDASCLSCHNQTGNGRFPDVLALNAWAAPGQSSYCRVVLQNALGNTMPGLGSAHDKHAQAMLAFCDQNPRPPGEVPPPDTRDDPEVLGPPVVIGPLYACAEAVEVSGASFGATLTVRIDGADVNAVTVTQPSQTIIKVPSLVAGQVVTAVQDEDGVVSAESEKVEVIDHTVAYPSGLPAPEIDPTLIHQCGRTIAVRHVRGAKVTVFTNGGDPLTYTSGGDWTNLPPAIRPFELGHRYSAEQSLCTDKSGPSNEEVAVLPPSPMPTPQIDPSPPISGQEVISLSNLANGALTEVLEASAGTLRTFSTAIDRMPEVDIATGLGGPLQDGDQILVVSGLCEDTKTEFPPARPCERLDAPRIAQPFVGATSVQVTDAVPGAHVIVFDSTLSEIGDGSGSPIGLTRALVPGDVLTVIQRLGECTSASAYQISAVCTSLDSDCG